MGKAGQSGDREMEKQRPRKTALVTGCDTGKIVHMIPLIWLLTLL